ncbi:alpha/beta fold hydrolase [Camelliibacillus cellulosilyticus]|uniref:Alpha/beta fold hydrolase n=1 Tax=Camelliibacillus cellulosilyticus TaxID=2174486 RepID=A0ABV9GFR3_9BACL
MGEKIILNNVSIYWEQHGQPKTSGAPILVFLHGYLSSCFSFRLLIPYLKDDFTILAFDLPGFGQSEKSRHFLYTLHNYGKLVLDFLRYVDVPECVLVGHSMGGQVALNAVWQSPERIQKVVGISAAGYMGRVRRSIVAATYLPFFHRILMRYFKKRDIMKMFLDVTYDKAIINKEMMTGYLEPLLEPAFYHSLIRLARHREGDLPPAALKKIQTPTLLLWGREDQIVPVSIGDRFSRDLPHAELIVYDKAGHLLPEEKPKEVAAAIRRFVKAK